MAFAALRSQCRRADVPAAAARLARFAGAAAAAAPAKPPSEALFASHGFSTAPSPREDALDATAGYYVSYAR